VYAVTQAGGIEEFTGTAGSSSWNVSDPTGGLAFPALQGPLVVVPSPGAPAAAVILAEAQDTDLIELSNQLDAPFEAIGPWHATDLTALGAPSVASSLSGASGTATFAAYVAASGDLEAVAVTSGLPGGFRAVDLTLEADAQPAAGATPVALGGPFGAGVAYRTTLGDLDVAAVPTLGVADLSFQRGTAEYVGSDPAGAAVGARAVILATDGGPIAPTPLARRIVLLATSFDQDHAKLQTTPRGSDCNPFTAAWGRGSTDGCAPGTAAEAWCSDFAQWVWQHAGVPTQGITGWSATFALWGAAHHRVQFGTHFHAAPGDAIVWGSRDPLYGTHVGLVVAVSGRYLDVVNGNDGGNLPGYVEGVWRSGPFIGATSTVSGYPVLAVVQP
jgi:hypothetical protein